jgi:hypothetical protein
MTRPRLSAGTSTASTAGNKLTKSALSASVKSRSDSLSSSAYKESYNPVSRVDSEVQSSSGVSEE